MVIVHIIRPLRTIRDQNHKQLKSPLQVFGMTTIPEIPKSYKAAVYDNPGSISTKVVDLDTPEPGPGEVLINLTASGVCHSDLAVMVSSMCTFQTTSGSSNAAFATNRQTAGHNSQLQRLPVRLVDTRASERSSNWAPVLRN